MPTIRITDETSVDVELGTAALGSTFAKYLRRPLQLVTDRQGLLFFRQQLATPVRRTLDAGITFAHEADLGSAGSTLTLKAGTPLRVAIQTVQDEAAIAAQWFSGIRVPPGSAYVSVGFSPTLNAATSVERGPLGFGFTAGTSVAALYAEPFDIAGNGGPTVGQCCRELLERHGLPGDVEDLANLRPGAYASVASEGSLTISSSVALEVSPNPLAAASVPIAGAIAVRAGGTVTAAFSGRVAGAFEIRVWKASTDRVRLGFFRRKDATWSADISATLGVEAQVRGRDALALLLGAVLGKPAVDVDAFLRAGLSDEQIDSIEQLVRDSVNRTLALSLDATFSSLRRDDAAFEYEITPGALDDEARAAVEAALDGDLTRLQALEDAGAAGGVRVIRSLHMKLRERRTVLKLNLFGLLNAASLEEFLRESRVAIDEDSGALVLADVVTARRLGIVTRAARVERERLRKVLLESIIATASYRAGQLADNVGVDLAQQYFEFHRETSQKTMRDNIEGLVALGLLSADEMEAALRPSLDDYGSSTFLLESTVPTEVCRDLFLTPANEPRTIADYEAIGRDALLAFVPPGTHDAFRRVVATNGALFNRLKAAGSDSRMDAVLAPVFGHGTDAAIVKRVIASDVVRIVWWAESMHRVASALAELIAHLDRRDPGAVRNDPAFVERRRALEEALAAMVKHSDGKFGDPWGLVAIDLAAGRRGGARAIIAAPTLIVEKSR